MAYGIAYLSNIAHIGAICGYMGMFGLWRSRNQDGTDVVLLKTSSYVAQDAQSTQWYPLVDNWSHVSLHVTCKDIGISLRN